MSAQIHYLNFNKEDTILTVKGVQGLYRKLKEKKDPGFHLLYDSAIQTAAYVAVFKNCPARWYMEGPLSKEENEVWIGKYQRPIEDVLERESSCEPPYPLETNTEGMAPGFLLEVVREVGLAKDALTINIERGRLNSETIRFVGQRDQENNLGVSICLNSKQILHWVLSGEVTESEYFQMRCRFEGKMKKKYQQGVS